MLVKGVPEFIKETGECTYMFSWPTALACIPVKTSSCSYKYGKQSILFFLLLLQLKCILFHLNDLRSVVLVF